MSVQEIEAIERRFYDAMNGHNIAALDKLFADNFVDHNAGPGLPPDREGEKQFFAMTFAALPDFHSTVEDMIVVGDKAVTRFTVRGTHKGEFWGIPATGKRITTTGIAIHRIAGGKIVDNWVNMDMLGVLQQIGAIPTPDHSRG